MNVVNLGTLVEIKTGKLDANASSENGKYPFFTCANEPLRIDSYSYDCECALVAGNGDLNVKYYNGKFDAYQRTYIIESKDKTILSVPYLYLFLESYVDTLRKQSIGGIIKYIKLGNLTNAPIPLRTLSKQTEIVERINLAKSIIAHRKQQLAKLDELVKARFVEMFGDVLKNDKKWIERPLGEICEKIVRYPTFYGMDYIESGTRVIRIGNILNDGHMETDDENYVFVYEGVNDDFPETVVEKNDIIMAVRGDGSAAKRIGFITENCLVGANISPNLIRIKANSSYVIPIFLFYYLTGEIGQKRLDAYVNKTAKKNIAAKDIVKVISPVPPLALQEQFAAFVAQTDKSKVAVQKSLDEAQLLFDSLMQEYFG